MNSKEEILEYVIKNAGDCGEVRCKDCPYCIINNCCVIINNSEKLSMKTNNPYYTCKVVVAKRELKNIKLKKTKLKLIKNIK